MNRSSISDQTRRILAKHGLKLKKRFGQNFLTDRHILEKIVTAAQIHPDVGVIEIGPGIGALTEKLAEQGRQVIAIELDHRLIPILDELFRDQANVMIIQGDALKVDMIELIGQFDHVQDIYVVANLPYYITSPLLIHLLKNRFPFKRIVVMMQKEVADRLTARPNTKEYGSLSVLAQYFAKIEQVFIVSRHVFIPQPKVDSSVVRFDIQESPSVQVVNEPLFFQLVRASFAKRRKTLVNALHAAYSPTLSKNKITELLRAAQIEPQRRGETCSLEEFARITEIFFDYFSSNQQLQLGG